VISATIFAIIAAAVGASLFSGMKIWDRARNVDFAKANVLLGLDIMAGELYQSIDMPQIAFEGTANELSFPSVSGSPVTRIGYNFNPGDKTLYKSKVGLSQVLKDKGEKDKKYPGEKFMALDDLSVAYYYYDKQKKIYLWVEKWSKADGPFKAVEFRARFRNDQFSKKIFIPISR
jgi:hypothetical protein